MTTTKKKTPYKPWQARVAFAISLIVLSIFPLFITFAPREWPLQSPIIAIDLVFLVILAGYLLVITGYNRSSWLVRTMTVVSVIGVAAMAWLAISLATLEIRW